MRTLSMMTLPLLAALACGESAPGSAPDLSGSGDLGTGAADLASAPDALAGDPQLPPTSSAAALEQWLAGGAYKAWACEKDPHPARSGSAHTANRICNNDLLGGSAAGEYPVNSASVKELFDANNKIIGYAVGVRTKAGATDDAWYWYERINTSVYGNGNGASLCAGCHRGAPRDYIFTQVKR